MFTCRCSVSYLSHIPSQCSCSSSPSIQGILLPCPTTLSAVNTTRTQLAQLISTQQAISSQRSDNTASAVNLLSGCVVLVMADTLIDEPWSMDYMRVGVAGGHSPQNTTNSTSMIAPHVSSKDHTAGLRARQVSLVVIPSQPVPSGKCLECCSDDSSQQTSMY